MMPDDPLSATTWFWGIATIACLIIAAPNTWLLIRTCRRRDKLWPFRLMSTLLFGSLGVAMLRNVAVWADYSWFGQYYLGSIDRRWRMDLVIAMFIMLACVWAAGLYIQTVREDLE